MVMTPRGINRVAWLMGQTTILPQLGRAPADEAECVEEYWKARGLVRRKASDQFVEEEQTWRAAPAALPAVAIAPTDTGACDANATNSTRAGKSLGAATDV